MKYPTLQQIIVLMLPIMLILVSIAGVVFPIIFNMYAYLPISIVFYSIPSIIIFICILFLKRNMGDSTSVLILSSRISEKHLQISFVILFIVSLFICHTSMERPPLYVVMVIFMTGCIACQIFLKKYSTTSILIQMSLLSMNILYTLTIGYSLYFGGTDIMNIADMTNAIQLTGGFTEDILGPSYYDWPLYFVYLVSSLLLSGIGNTTTDVVKYIQLISPMICAISSIIIYKLMFYLSNNNRVALYSSLLYLLFPIWVSFSYHILARTISYTAFLLIIFLFFMRYMGGDQRKLIDSKKISIFALNILLFIVMLISHQLTIFLVMGLLTLGIIIWLLCFHQIRVFPELILAYIVTLVYWISFNGWTFLSSQLKTRMYLLSNGDTGSTIGGYSMGDVSSILPYLFENVYWIPLLIISVVGGYAILSGKFNKLFSPLSHRILLVISILALVALVIYVPSPLTVSSLASMFAIDRFQMVCLPLIVVLISLSTYYISLHLPRMHGVNFGVVFSVFVVLVVSSSSILFADDYMGSIFHERDRYFTTGELSGIYFVDEYVPIASTLSVDHFLHRYYLHKEEKISSKLNLPYYDLKTVTNIFGNSSDRGGYTIFRTNAFYKTGIYTYYEEYNKYSPTEYNIIRLRMFVDSKQKIYDTDPISISFQ